MKEISVLITAKMRVREEDEDYKNPLDTLKHMEHGLYKSFDAFGFESIDFESAKEIVE